MRRRRRVREQVRCEVGQTTTEYVMISGLMTAIIGTVLSWIWFGSIFNPFNTIRYRLREIGSYIVDGVADPPF